MPSPDSFDSLPQFARLLEEFPRLCRAAEVLIGLPREHDAAVVRLAIIGYSFHCNTGTWTDGDSTAVKECRTALPVSAFSHAWICFACLATGFLIGARRSGAASDLETMLAESLLPGFMMQHRGQIEGLYMATQIKPADAPPPAQSPAPAPLPAVSVTTHTAAAPRPAGPRT